MSGMKSFFLFLLISGTAFAQSLNVTYDGKTTAVDLSTFKRDTTIKSIDPHDKSEHAYSCVPMKSILAAANVPMAEALHGKALSLVVVASAKDNYRAVFSLAELNEGMAVHPTLAYVCDSDNGKPFGEKEAPLKLLVTTDKHPSRSVRMLTGLEIKSTQ